MTELAAVCPLPVPRWLAIDVPKMGLGDVVEMLAKPIAKVLGLKCLDEQGQLKPESGCARRRSQLNKIKLPHA